MAIRRGQVWWWKCPAHAREHLQEGVRPVVIVSNDACNAASPVITVVPLTSRVKNPYPQQACVILNDRICVALTDQITSIPVSELDTYMCTLREFQLDQVDTAIAVQLGFVDVKDRPYSVFERRALRTEDGTR